MRFVSCNPPQPFADAIASIWCFEGTDLAHELEQIVPNGSMQLLVNLADDQLRWQNCLTSGVEYVRGAAFSGVFTRSFVIDTAQQQIITGVSFCPGGAAAFFGGSMKEFSNTHIAFSDVLGSVSIRDQLLEAWSLGGAAVLRTWVRFLEARWNPSRLARVTVSRKLLETGASIQRAAELTSVSVRKFRQDFSEAFGLAPKVYGRIHRLKCLVERVATRREPPDWARLALSHGYFDQAHMIREFRALTGTTPMNYAPRSPAEWNHMVVPIRPIKAD